MGKGLFSPFGLFSHTMGRWASKIYPVIATVIIAVVAIVINYIVMLIER
jgi:hypothetical protein